MFSFLADIVLGFFEFVADVLLFRSQRRQRGSRERSVAEDSLEVARFDFGTLLLIALVCATLMLLLSFGLGLPVAWSVGIGIAVGVAWGLWRYGVLLRA
jgi:hypothetical protein